ncbi:MAG: hypothetical protein IT456_22070 [Planctomycetes bacterium]|nr:hypothetical protein [Planctomycetota bacterium]
MRLSRDPADRRFQHYCETGDPVALGYVSDRTAGQLLRVALWLGGNRADAEDLLQRTVDSTDPWALYWGSNALFQWNEGLWEPWCRRLAEIALRQSSAGKGLFLAVGSRPWLLAGDDHGAARALPGGLLAMRAHDPLA